MKSNFGFSESSMLVYYYMKLIGLAPFTLKNTEIHPPTILGKVYPVCVTVGYLILTSTTFTPVIEKTDAVVNSRFVKIRSSTHHFIGLPSTLGTLIIFLFKHKKIVYLINKLCSMSDDLKRSSIEEDHGTFFKNLLLTTVTANVIVVTTLLTLILIEPYLSIVVTIKHGIDSWFGLNTVLIFAQILFCIGHRFKLVNKKLHDLLVPIRSRRSLHNSQNSFMSRSNNREENQPRREGIGTDFQSLRMIENLHIELSDLLNRTNQLFATPILLNSLRFFIELVLNSYWISFSFLNTSHLDIFFVLSGLLRIVSVSVQLFIIAHASVKICQQGNATKDVLFDVWNKLMPAELIDAGIHCMFSKFSDQLLHTTVVVSFFGFVNLGYSFMYKIFVTVITYVIIVMQFEISRTTP